MNNDIPDTALAQTLATLAAIRPVALTCIGAGSAVLVVALLMSADQGILTAMIQTAIMAVVSFAATRHFLSEGQAPLLTPTQTVRTFGFIPFLQLEWLVTAVFEIIDRLSEMPGIFSAIGFPGLIALIFFLAKFGTIFPAIVAGGDTSLAAAAERQTTGALLMRLIAAYGLGFMMAASLILLPSIALEQSAGMDAPLGVALMAPFMVAINVFVSVLIAVVLSKAYQGRYRP